MKRYILGMLMFIFCLQSLFSQSNIYKLEGTCGPDTKWIFDGYTLSILNINKEGQTVAIDDYDLKEQKAPWSKKSIRRVQINEGITRIGACAFANLKELQEVVFMGTNVREIGWGAFLNCVRLRNFSMPYQVRSIETIAFANCSSLASVKIPDQCRVADQAFVSCTGLQALELSPTSILGHLVFASEVKIENKIRHALYHGEIRHLPSYINKGNCEQFGFSVAAVERSTSRISAIVDYDYQTSHVDSIVPMTDKTSPDTYALIIGNQNYRFVSDVPYAIHDARVFGEYCKKTLGIPAENIHITEDATKQMILEEELEDWVQSIPNKDSKKLVVYYAGHGVPDIKNHNKSYLLPTDVRGTSPQRGISLDDFYRKLGELAFSQTTVFLDACFSGVNRNHEGVTEGLRGVEIDAEEATLNGGSLIVFSAAKGNETAQAYPEQGHGLFTYYLLKGIQDTEGQTTLGYLSDYINYNVSKQAPLLKMRKKQTPSTNTSDQVADSWRRLEF